MNEKDLLKRLVVQFTDEETIDAGALTTAMYSRFFKASINLLFEKLTSESNVFVPKEDDKTNNSTEQYEALGKLLF
jgi:hypothetical protein